MLRAKAAFVRSNISNGNEISGAKRGAIRGRRRATQGDAPGRSIQLDAAQSDTRRHPATVRRCLLSSGSRVRMLPGAPASANLSAGQGLLGGPPVCH